MRSGTALRLASVCFLGVALAPAQTPTLEDLQNKLLQFEESTQKTIQELKAQIAALQKRPGAEGSCRARPCGSGFRVAGPGRSYPEGVLWH